MTEQAKKKSIVPKIIILFFVFVVVILGILFFVYQNRKATSEETLVDQFLNAYVQQDPTCADFLLNSYAGGVDFSKEQSALSKNLTYKIKGSRTEGEYAIISVEIENLDFAKIIDPLVKENTMELKESDILVALQEKGENIKKTYPCEVVVYKGGFEDKIIVTEDLSEALLGGLNEYIETLLYEREE